MNRICILGIGNCGSQIASLAEQSYPELFTSVYINSSSADLAMVKSDTSLKFKIGTENKVEGSGKDRSRMKELLEDEIVSILNNAELRQILTEVNYCFLCSSTAGGTGSGSSPVMMDLLRSVFPQCQFIMVAVLPRYDASMMELGNTLEFLDELYNRLNEEDRRVTYMMYDNETVSGMSPTLGLEFVNRNIVEDIRVLTGIDCYPSPYETIDDGDMKKIITTPGRLIVSRIPSEPKEASILSEKNMEDCDLGDVFVRQIKRSTHCEIDRDKRTMRRGVITYFDERVNQLYSGDLSKLDDFLGTPVESFAHNAINPGSEKENFMYVIASGLSPIADRTERVKGRLQELREALKPENKFSLGADDLVPSSMRQEIDADATKVREVVPSEFFQKFRSKK